MKPTREAVGLPWVTFHTFRHTCASLLFEAGRNVKQVSEWLGHADPAFTLRRDVHVMDAGVGDADFLDDAVSVDAGGVGGLFAAFTSMPEEGLEPPTRGL